MKGKRRTPLSRSPARKRKPGSKPVSPRPKGEAERLAVRRLAAMKYRLAGASYRAIAEKLTDERASEYADANGISFERAMKKIPHVSVRTVWDDVTAEMEELRRETEVQRMDLMALENARLDQVFSKALSLFANGSVPAGRLAIATMGRRCLFVAGSLPVRVPQRAGVEVRGERFERGVAFGGEAVPTSRGVGHFGVPLLLVNHGRRVVFGAAGVEGFAIACQRLGIDRVEHEELVLHQRVDHRASPLFDGNPHGPAPKPLAELGD